jgi:hypothetical protein
MRRAGAVFAAMMALSATAAVTGTAFADNGRDNNDGPGAEYQGNYNCTGDDQANNYHAQNYGNSWIAC